MKRKHSMKLVGWVEHLSNLGFAKNSHPIMEGWWIIMKKYYAYVAKEVVGYFEEKLAEHGVKTMKREPINNGEIYYYVVEAEDGIIDPRFEIKGA